jgi:hypothetical protein
VCGQTCKSKRELRKKRICINDGMGERSRAHAFIVPWELTWVDAMKSEVTTLLVLIPCFVLPTWFVQRAIKSS